MYSQRDLRCLQTLYSDPSILELMAYMIRHNNMP